MIKQIVLLSLISAVIVGCSARQFNRIFDGSNFPKCTYPKNGYHSFPVQRGSCLNCHSEERLMTSPNVDWTRCNHDYRADYFGDEGEGQ